jgi:prolyl-tRNA editing enzyme YbaK/EbsC (Cys-tRNA(Pro) deacylase)
MTDKSLLDPSVAKALDELGMQYRVLACDPALADTAAFCEHYGFSTGQSANAIIVATKAAPVRFACCVVLATTKLDVNKKVSLLLGTKKLSFATAEQTQALTGMQIGGVTPFGLPDTPVYIDSAVTNVADLIFGGGNRGSKVIMQPEELHKIPNVEFVEGLAIAKIG